MEARLGSRNNKERPSEVRATGSYTKQIVVGSGTPGGRRAIMNMLAELKCQGFIWPWPPPNAKGKKD